MWFRILEGTETIYEGDEGVMAKAVYNNKTPLFVSRDPYEAYCRYERMVEEAFRENILFIADFGIPKEQYKRNTGIHFKRTDRIDDVIPYFVIGEFHDDEIEDLYKPSILRVDERYFSREFVNDSYSAFDCFLNNSVLRGNVTINLVSTIRDRYGIKRTGERVVADRRGMKEKRYHYKKIATYRVPVDLESNPNVIPFHALTCMTNPRLIEADYREV